MKRLAVDLREHLFDWEPTPYAETLEEKLPERTEALTEFRNVCDWWFRLHMQAAAISAALASALLAAMVIIMSQHITLTGSRVADVLINIAYGGFWVLALVGAVLYGGACASLIVRAGKIRDYYTEQVTDRWLR